MRAARPPLDLVALVTALAALAWTRGAGWALVLVPVTGALAVWAVGRRLSDDRWATRLALLHLAVASGVAGLLYLLSAVRPPIIASFVLKKGFWVFGGDAVYYHQRGLQIAHAIHHAVPFPEMDRSYGGSFLGLTGLAYVLLHPHPLVGPLINAILGGFVVLLVYATVARFATAPAARAAAVAVAVWPSLLLWSSQLMKDTPTLFLFFVLLFLVCRVLDERRPLSRPVFALSVVAVLSGAMLLFTLRFYLVLVALFALAATLAGLALIHRRFPRLRHTIFLLTLVCATLLGVIAGSDFILVALNPADSQAVRTYRDGLRLENERRLAESREQYYTAIAQKPDFWPAYRRLGEVLVRMGELDEAAPVLERSLELNPYDYSAPVVQAAIQHLSTTRGDAAARSRLAPLIDRSFATAAKVYGEDGSVMVAGADEIVSHLFEQSYGRAFRLLQFIRLGGLAMARNGFVRSGGASLSTNEIVAEDESAFTWVIRSPGAFLTALGAPFPGQWSAGRATFLRWTAGLEGFVLLALLPLAVIGVWRLLSTDLGVGLWLIAVLVVTATAMGLTVVNVGTLVRLRLPVAVLVVMLAGCGSSALPLLLRFRARV